jgi:uncharacterized membrane protein
MLQGTQAPRPLTGMASAESRPAERILLAPHRSLSRREARWFLASLCVPSLTIALLMTARGYWPVLPFAGLELAAVAAALWFNMRQAGDTQQIVVSEDGVTIETRCRGRIIHSEFSRHWARVKLRRAKTPWHPSRLTIESHGRSCELGSFLTEEARCALAGRLRRLIGRVDESPRLLPDDCTIKV